MKFIFLDIDGVLNSRFNDMLIGPMGSLSDKELGDYHLERLKKICDVTDAQIVLSSDWRLTHGFFNTDGLFYNLGIKDTAKTLLDEKLEKFGLKIVGFTPYINDGEDREKEIKVWLDRYSKSLQIDSFVILDDKKLSGFGNNFIHINKTRGLCDEDVSLAIKILGKKDKEVPIMSHKATRVTRKEIDEMINCLNHSGAHISYEYKGDKYYVYDNGNRVSCIGSISEVYAHLWGIKVGLESRSGFYPVPAKMGNSKCPTYEIWNIKW